jgi:hypothetical protein
MVLADSSRKRGRHRVIPLVTRLEVSYLRVISQQKELLLRWLRRTQKRQLHVQSIPGRWNLWVAMRLAPPVPISAPQ